jgi:phosphatidylserine/phosphatidylglycerophosphate/cardiolipin synthase-like enzyme
LNRSILPFSSSAMSDALRQIGFEAMKLATRLPQSVLLSFADALLQHDMDWPSSRSVILQSLPTVDFRDAATEFLNTWRSLGTNVSPHAVSAALITAAEAEFTHRQKEIVEIVWTGPETSGNRFRRTEQAILEVLDSAKQRLTVASYALYRVPRIRDSLIAAANRGVRIRLIVETPNQSEGRNEYDNLIALGEKVASVSTIYYWPHGNRRTDDNGKRGILHVKCAIADGRRLFLSSANLTEHAFTNNMELGLLITGGKLPAEVQEHFDRLIQSGCLVPVQTSNR